MIRAMKTDPSTTVSKRNSIMSIPDIIQLTLNDPEEHMTLKHHIKNIIGKTPRDITTSHIKYPTTVELYFDATEVPYITRWENSPDLHQPFDSQGLIFFLQFHKAKQLNQMTPELSEIREYLEYLMSISIKGKENFAEESPKMTVKNHHNGIEQNEVPAPQEPAAKAEQYQIAFKSKDEIYKRQPKSALICIQVSEAGYDYLHRVFESADGMCVGDILRKIQYEGGWSMQMELQDVLKAIQNGFLLPEHILNWRP